MDMSLVARNVTFARMILRVIFSLCFLMGLSKPVVIQSDYETNEIPTVANNVDVFQLVSHLAEELVKFSEQGEQEASGDILEIAGDEYWRYHLDCDRWGVVLATPAEHQVQPQIENPFESIEDNSITDTQLAAQIAVPEELQQPAQGQSVIDFLDSLELPWMDEIDVLLLAAEIEVGTELESDLPVHVHPLVEVTNADAVVAKMEDEQLEQPSFNILSMIDTPDSIYDFGNSAIHWSVASDAEFVEANELETDFGPICNLDFATLDSANETNARPKWGSPLPSIAFALFRESLRSPIWHSPRATIIEMQVFMRKHYGGSLLYQMSEDVLFNIELDLSHNMGLSREAEQSNNQSPGAPANSAEVYRWTADKLHWMSFQLQKAALSISRTAKAADSEIR